MTDTQTFIVSCKHKVAKYARDKVEVTARQDRYDKRWYCSMDGFGCSKSYRLAEDAIRGMLAEHGCFDVHVDPKQADEFTFLGHPFRPLTPQERLGFLDAGPKAVCCNIHRLGCEEVMAIFDPMTGTLEEYSGGRVRQFQLIQEHEL